MNKLIVLGLSILVSCSGGAHQSTDVATGSVPVTLPVEKKMVLEAKIFSNDTLKANTGISGFGYDIYRDK